MMPAPAQSSCSGLSRTSMNQEASAGVMMHSRNSRHIRTNKIRRFILNGRLMRKSTASELLPARITHSVGDDFLAERLDRRQGVDIEDRQHDAQCARQSVAEDIAQKIAAHPLMIGFQRQEERRHADRYGGNERQLDRLKRIDRNQKQREDAQDD